MLPLLSFWLIMGCSSASSCAEGRAGLPGLPGAAACRSNTRTAVGGGGRALRAARSPRSNASWLLGTGLGPPGLQGAAAGPQRVVRACSSLTLGSGAGAGAAALASSARTSTAARREGRWLLTRAGATATAEVSAHCMLASVLVGWGWMGVGAAAGRRLGSSFLPTHPMLGLRSCCDPGSAGGGQALWRLPRACIPLGVACGGQGAVCSRRRHPPTPAAQKSGLLSPRCTVFTPLNDAAREGLRKSIGKAVLATCCSRRRQPAGGGRQNGCPLLGGAATRGARAPSLARLQQPCYVVTQPPALGTSVANYECSWLRLVLHARCRLNWRGTRAAANASEQTQYMTMRARPMLKAWKAGMG